MIGFRLYVINTIWFYGIIASNIVNPKSPIGLRQTQWIGGLDNITTL
jgi:hypothetical protein